jgi:hypothetical protein
MFQIETDGVLNGHLVFPVYVRINKKKYRMCLSSPQTRLKISGFVNLQGKIKRIDCDSVKMNYFPETQ